MEQAYDWYETAMDGNKAAWDSKRESILNNEGIDVREMVEKVERKLKK